MPPYRIAVFAGDGIGPEVVAEALKVLDAVGVPGRLELAFEKAGEGIANPLATILSAGLMLEWLGRRDGNDDAVTAAAQIEAAVDAVTGDSRVLTPDLGGTATTPAVGDAVVGALAAASDRA